MNWISILVSIIIGAVAGWLASIIMKTKGGLLRNIIIGVLGGFIGSWLFGLLGISISLPYYLDTVLVSVVGACLLIFVASKIFK